MVRTAKEKKIKHAGNVIAEQIAKASVPKRTFLEKKAERIKKQQAKEGAQPIVLSSEYRAARKAERRAMRESAEKADE